MKHLLNRCRIKYRLFLSFENVCLCTRLNNWSRKKTQMWAKKKKTILFRLKIILRLTIRTLFIYYSITKLFILIFFPFFFFICIYIALISTSSDPKKQNNTSVHKYSNVFTFQSTFYVENNTAQHARHSLAVFKRKYFRRLLSIISSVVRGKISFDVYVRNRKGILEI